MLKDSAVTDIVSCIRAVAAGENYASPELVTYLVKRAGRDAPLTRLAPLWRNLQRLNAVCSR